MLGKKKRYVWYEPPDIVNGKRDRLAKVEVLYLEKSLLRMPIITPASSWNQLVK